MKSIRYGEADVMIAGGSEAVVTELGDRRLRRGARALDAQRRPGEREPSLGQGPRRLRAGRGRGRVVLEEYEHAKARGARIYCELAGYGMSADAYHMTAPSEDGDGAFRCMRNALKDAAVRAGRQVDYINAHGTSTPLGDIAETKAVKRLLGEHAPRRR